MNVHEKEIEYLKSQLQRINNYSSIINSKKINFDSSFSEWYLSNIITNKNEKYQIFSQQLKDEYIRIQSFVSEANFIANEMEQNISYNVILQIPISYLKPNERNINNLCEIAIQVKQKNSIIQIWDIEKFQLKFNNMKEIYQHSKLSELISNNLFIDQELESLIGVANIHLKALFYGSKLDFIVPIINTQGEFSGSLHVVLDQTESNSIKTLNDFQINSTTQGSMSEGIGADIDEYSLSISQPSLEDEGIEEYFPLSNNKNEEITVKFAIKEARNIPKTDAECIVCRYTFINPKLDQTIISNKFLENQNEEKLRIFYFDHENEYTFPITDEFLSTCFQGAISIEVWNQYKTKNSSTNETDDTNPQVKAIAERWKDVKRHIQFNTEIHELDPTGQWGPVQVDVQDGILSGGIYRLKQGQSKRLVTYLRILPRTDGMPLTLNAIRSVEIGSITTRKLNAPRQLDSYQDEDLSYLKREWLDLIEKKKLYLESQVNMINQQIDKTPEDIKREEILLEQLVRLAEERNIAVFPPSGTGIPGAPAAWDPPVNIEKHRPLIFLNIDMSNDTAGFEAILPEENKTKMYPLPLIQNASENIEAIALWDPSIHESTALNQVTPQDTLIYLIVKIVVLISEPVPMEVILRKRIAVTISKTEGWWPGKTLKNLLGYKTYKRTSVIYEIVSRIPKIIYSNNDEKSSVDIKDLSENLIEKYIQYASTIDSTLLLDKLRQEVLLGEKSVKQQTMKKSTSVPNMGSQKKPRNLFHSPANTRRENVDNQLLSMTFNQTELNESTPSIKSRTSFIEEQQIEPIQTTTKIFKIKHTIDLDNDKQEQNDENTLEQKYSIVINKLIKENISNNNIEDYSIGCRVIVNTGRSIFNKLGIIRYIGEISIQKDIWYGIELEEGVGKNNGSLNEHTYFQCQDYHGIFVRRDKLRRVVD